MHSFEHVFISLRFHASNSPPSIRWSIHAHVRSFVCGGTCSPHSTLPLLHRTAQGPANGLMPTRPRAFNACQPQFTQCRGLVLRRTGPGGRPGSATSARSHVDGLEERGSKDESGEEMSENRTGAEVTAEAGEPEDEEKVKEEEEEKEKEGERVWLPARLCLLLPPARPYLGPFADVLQVDPASGAVAVEEDGMTSSTDVFAAGAAAAFPAPLGWTELLPTQRTTARIVARSMVLRASSSTPSSSSSSASSASASSASPPSPSSASSCSPRALAAPVSPRIPLPLPELRVEFFNLEAKLRGSTEGVPVMVGDTHGDVLRPKPTSPLIACFSSMPLAEASSEAADLCTLMLAAVESPSAEASTSKAPAALVLLQGVSFRFSRLHLTHVRSSLPSPHVGSFL